MKWLLRSLRWRFYPAEWRTRPANLSGSWPPTNDWFSAQPTVCSVEWKMPKTRHRQSLRLFKNLGRVGDDPKPWLYRVTVNLCNDYYRRRTLVAEPDERRADPAPDPLSLLTMDERKRL